MSERPENPYKVKKKASVGWCILWFFIGLLIPIVTIGVAIGLVPASTYLDLAGLTNGLSSALSGQSILSILMSYQTLTFGDLPFLQTVVDNAINNSGYGKYISIDWDALSTVKFTSSTLSKEVGAALQISASLKSLEEDGILTLDTKLKELPCFSETWVEVDMEKFEKTEDTVYGLYYCLDESGNYVRAFDDEGNYVNGATSETQLYLVSLYEANLMDCASVMASRLQAEDAETLINVLTGAGSSSTEQSFIAKIVSGKTVGELGEITNKNIYLADIIDETEENQKMRDILVQCILDEEGNRKTWEELTLYDLGNVNTDLLSLTTVLPEEGNEKLYTILMDMTGSDSVDAITLESLNGADIGLINIWNVMDGTGEDVQGNAFLKALYNETGEAGLKVGDLGNNINNLSIYQVFGEVCFTKNAEPTAEGATDYAVDNDGYNYVKSTNEAGLVTYTMTTDSVTAENDVYYISQEAGCWLMFCYDVIYDTDESITLPSGYGDSTGRPYMLTEDADAFTIGQLEDDSSSVANRFQTTTLYTLFMTNLVDEQPGTTYSTAVLSMTIADIIDTVAKLPTLSA